jgi:hypothetical protein
MDDLFGPRSGRPDSSDFWRLSPIVLELDERIEAVARPSRPEEWLAIVAASIDPDGIVHVAMQRAMRIGGPPTGVPVRLARGPTKRMPESGRRSRQWH